MTLKKCTFSIVLIAAVLFVGSCSKNDDNTPNPEQNDSTTTVVTVKDLAADPIVSDPDGGRPSGGTGQYTFFRFSDSTMVAHEDSAGLKWDIAFQGTNIILNNNIHGEGDVTGKAVTETLFKDLMQIPANGFRADSTTGDVFGSWYNYNSNTHIINPQPGYIFIIHTNDGAYVKMQVISYYKGAPDEVTSDDISRYYTFKYAFLSNKK